MTLLSVGETILARAPIRTSPADGGGSVPPRNHSFRAGSVVRESSTRRETRAFGGGGSSLEPSPWRRSMISSQAGAAPLTPLTSCIASPEKFPTQTPTVYRLENPTHQLSRMSLLVPVLTALQNRVARALSSPNVALRLSRSASTSETMKAA